MNSSPSRPSRSVFRSLVAFACASSLAFAIVPALSAVEPTLAARADKALPLSHTFEKVESTEGKPFVLNLRNDSNASLKLSGKVLLSVVNHAMDKARPLPEHTLEAGKTWSIPGLTADDKVIISSAGYADLEIRVPFKL